MKKLVSVLLLAALIAALIPCAMADSIYNYSLYEVRSFNPNGYCYLYDRPSSSQGRNLGRHENGELVGVIGYTDEHGGFYYVYCANGKYGYIHADALIAAGHYSSNEYCVVASERTYCYLYDQPSSVYGRNLGRYENGEIIEILDWYADDDYAQVRCVRTDKIGYIRKTNLCPLY